MNLLNVKVKNVRRQGDILKLKNFYRTLKVITKNSAVKNYVSQLIFARIYNKIGKEIIANVYNLEEKFDLNDYLDFEDVPSNYNCTFYCHMINAPKNESINYSESIFITSRYKLNLIVYDTSMSIHFSRHNNNARKSLVIIEPDANINYAGLNTVNTISNEYYTLTYKFKDFRKMIRRKLFVYDDNLIDKFIEKLIENIITDNKLEKI